MIELKTLALLATILGWLVLDTKIEVIPIVENVEVQDAFFVKDIKPRNLHSEKVQPVLLYNFLDSVGMGATNGVVGEEESYRFILPWWNQVFAAKSVFRFLGNGAIGKLRGVKCGIVEIDCRSYVNRRRLAEVFHSAFNDQMPVSNPKSGTDTREISSSLGLAHFTGDSNGLFGGFSGFLGSQQSLPYQERTYTSKQYRSPCGPMEPTGRLSHAVLGCKITPIRLPFMLLVAIGSFLLAGRGVETGKPIMVLSGAFVGIFGTLLYAGVL